MVLGVKIASQQVAERLSDALKKSGSPIALKARESFSSNQDSEVETQSTAALNSKDRFVSFEELKNAARPLTDVKGFDTNRGWKYAHEGMSYVLDEYKKATRQTGETAEITTAAQVALFTKLLTSKEAFLLSGGVVVSELKGGHGVSVAIRSDITLSDFRKHIVPYNVFNFLSDVEFSYVLPANEADNSPVKSSHNHFNLVTMVRFLGAWPTVTKAHYEEFKSGGFRLSWKWSKNDTSLEWAKNLVTNHRAELKEALKEKTKKPVTDPKVQKTLEELVKNLEDVNSVDGAMTCENNVCTYEQAVNSKFNPPSMTPVAEAALETTLHNISDPQDKRSETRPSMKVMWVKKRDQGDKISYEKITPAH